MKIVSSCLAGIRCKYSGGDNEVASIKQLVEEGKAIPVCPEMLGDLPCPRPSCEIQQGRVINTLGQDKSEEFMTGAKKALQICKAVNPDEIILKAFSPSCGVGEIYDGTFSHKKIKGNGIFGQMCKEEGYTVMSDIEYEERRK